MRILRRKPLPDEVRENLEKVIDSAIEEDRELDCVISGSGNTSIIQDHGHITFYDGGDIEIRLNDGDWGHYTSDGDLHSRLSVRVVELLGEELKRRSVS